MKKNYYFLIALLTLPFFASAQRWKAERSSIVFGLGMSHFMGDLGGGKKTAAHYFGVRDLDFVTTRPAIFFGYRYRMTEEFSFEPTLSYARLSGKDIASANLNRRMRNLSFRTNIWELGGQFEYAFLKEKQNPRYSFASLRAMRNLSAFVILGGGVFYYNPKTKLGNKWIALRPLHTEGQGQASYVYNYQDEFGIPQSETITPHKEYKKFAGELTFGLGLKYNLDRHWSIGLEITNRFSTTDYLDDAHDRYYNYTELGTTPPKLETLLVSDKHTNPGTAEYWPSGQKYRGDPKYKDAYVLTLVTAHYKFKNTVRGLPKF